MLHHSLQDCLTVRQHLYLHLLLEEPAGQPAHTNTIAGSTPHEDAVKALSATWT